MKPDVGFCFFQAARDKQIIYSFLGRRRRLWLSLALAGRLCLSLAGSARLWLALAASLRAGAAGPAFSPLSGRAYDGEMRRELGRKQMTNCGPAQWTTDEMYGWRVEVSGRQNKK